MAAHGGGGGGESAPASYGVPTATGGTGSGLFGGLSSILQGYQQERTLRGQEKQQKIENKQAADTAAEKKTMDTATITSMNLENVAAQATATRLAKQDATTDATTRVDNVTNQAVKFPELARDPVMMNQYIADMNTLGRPVVRNKDGSVNWDAMNPKQFSDLSVEDKARYQAMNPDDRNLAMKGIGGIPPRFLKVGASYTPEAQARLTTAAASGTRAATGATHEANVDRMNNSKLGFTERLTAAKTAYTEAQSSTVKALALAKINELQAQAQKASVEASAVGPKLQIAEQNLGIRSQELGVQLQRLQYDTSPTSLKNLHNSTVALDEFTTRTESELDGAKKALATYAATKNDGVISVDDPIGQKLQGTIGRLEGVLYSATQQSNKARSALVNNQFPGMAMTRQSGGRQSTIMPRRGAASGGTPVGTAPAGTADGTTTQYQGKTLTARGGKWYGG
jgi:hypothetical protein